MLERGINVPMTVERFAIGTKEIPYITPKIGTKQIEIPFNIYQLAPRAPEKTLPSSTGGGEGRRGGGGEGEVATYVTSDIRAKYVKGSQELPGGKTWKVVEKYAKEEGFVPKNIL